MTAAERFLFDVDFDEPQPSSAPVEPEEECPPPPSFSEAELEAARQEAHAIGREQGREEAARAIEQDCATSLVTLSGQLERLGQQLDGRLAQIERDSLLAALTMVRKLFPALARREELTEIEAILQDCLQRLHDEPRIVVRFREAVLDSITPRLEEISSKSGFEGRLVLLSDSEFTASDVRVEWADGGAERNSERMWAKIEERLCQFMNANASSGAAPRHEPDAPDVETGPTNQPLDDQQGLPR